ncbi:probable rRNA maturation factor [Caloranaerobacter azorensis DSM 13643]|uniref:Endoribonuclease YbeY n=1 Tax=Caloranaerobacter azorensis DSM 13643 TaxID=1121264 RepID=A0A1M5S8F5_9FIRM|nr:rRNA maturation RNase YbeY [Caloranaerobacter azorensis]SHH34725.1 probable rRNA maturation factor [Caloranaerobacter azorensis DSM 13643]
MELLIDDRQNKVIIEEDVKDAVRDVILECLKLEGLSSNYEISVSFVDNEEIRKLNREYRGKDSPTDVLSFPMEDEEIDEGYIPVLGDIVISAEKALQQSIEFGHSFKREVAYLTAHSMFHLMGYDHETEEEKLVMRQKEKEVMKRLRIFKTENN